MTHTCHAVGCSVVVAPKLLMCRRHWFMVPRDLRRAVWLHYVEGQCDLDPPPSKEWHTAADRAIKAVARKEFGPSCKPPPKKNRMRRRRRPKE